MKARRRDEQEVVQPSNSHLEMKVIIHEGFQFDLQSGENADTSVTKHDHSISFFEPISTPRPRSPEIKMFDTPIRRMVSCPSP